jgi:hypothetical protein
MKTSTMAAIVSGVLLFAATVAGLAGYLWAENANGIETPPPRGLPAVWPTKHGQLPRPVPMPTGEMITALPQATAGHVLCEALPQQRWEDILGGTTVREAQDDTCHLATETLDISVRLEKASPEIQQQNTQPVTVSGREGRLGYAAPKTNAMLTVPLTAPPKKADDDIRTVLRVDIGLDPNRPGSQELDHEATDIARGIVDATMKPGPALPVEGKDGAIPAKPAEPIPGFGITGSAYPMISWELCTRLGQELGANVATTVPEFQGSCMVRGVKATYTQETSPRAYAGTLAGRPVSVQGNTVVVKLLDKSDETLTLTTDGKTVKDADLPAFTARVLPSLLGRSN